MCIHEKYINPFTDYGFKKIFGDEENTELLESLINDILGLEGEKKIAKISTYPQIKFKKLGNDGFSLAYSGLKSPIPNENNMG